ncbi:hypothetical protein BDP81DRAFT_128174 [Colletotrichum phormii]|uniref:Uncharacterized protein n=1 Tax=Colletotrichum phormii TaxID=359342 RepID=A0AAJ0ELJ9_9PEZI|nr:uncharacterized protein BDP81DRAFT_128174 [Colletotrichum phormii]KAK1641141.1 hypothetical protein BDP81DRAFT_128174 [Colletotrichum phormii]
MFPIRHILFTKPALPCLTTVSPESTSEKTFYYTLLRIHQHHLNSPRHRLPIRDPAITPTSTSIFESFGGSASSAPQDNTSGPSLTWGPLLAVFKCCPPSSVQAILDRSHPTTSRTMGHDTGLPHPFLQSTQPGRFHRDPVCLDGCLVLI